MKKLVIVRRLGLGILVSELKFTGGGARQEVS